MRVFVLAVSGLLNKQIAFRLGIAEATVKAHMTAVLRKLNVNDRTQAANTPLAMSLEGGVEPAGNGATSGERLGSPAP
jgi:DNA-binding NarL/FixJ family response regulator